jgi:hypothetical protein
MPQLVDFCDPGDVGTSGIGDAARIGPTEAVIGQLALGIFDGNPPPVKAVFGCP